MNLKKFYETWNAGGVKNLQVITISADSDEGGFNRSMADMPWVALPLKSDEASKLDDKVPCTGYPTPGVINGETGAVINPDVFGKVNADSFSQWTK